MNKKIILYIFSIFYFYSICFLYSQEYIPQIDQIISSKDINGLKKFIEGNQKKENYKAIEGYIVNKAKDLVKNKEYEIAKQILETVLFYDFDNQEAQDIYLSLQLLSKDKVVIEEKKKEKELAKEITIAKKEFEEMKKVSFKNFLFQFEIGAVNFTYYQSGFYNDFYDETKNNFKYGLSTLDSFYFIHPYIATGIDLYFDSYFTNLYPQSGTEISYKIMLGLTTPLIKVPLYFRVGYGQMIFYFSESTKVDVFAKNIYSPLIGFRVKDFYFNKYVGINGSFDYYLISAFTSYFNAAFDINLGVLCRYYSFKNVNFYIKSEVLAYFLIGYEKLENNVKIQISAGISLNEK